MLIETRLAAGTDHMMQLGERRFLVWDRAEHKRDDTSIEGRGHARKAQAWVVRRVVGPRMLSAGHPGSGDALRWTDSEHQGTVRIDVQFSSFQARSWSGGEDGGKAGATVSVR
jgi:hypothetical protein